VAENTAISWASDTFNPWIGCTRISPACDGCYAANLMGMEGRMKRVEWGEPGCGAGTRARTAPANWRQPLKWNREAAAEVTAWEKKRAGFPQVLAVDPGPRPQRFVFCASLADVFDNEVDPTWRADLFLLIHSTPHLTWLLLTKRPGNIMKLGPMPGAWPRNAAIGTTVEDQVRADQNIPRLLAAKAALNPAFAFVSMEPLLGPVDLRRISTLQFRGAEILNALTGELEGLFGDASATRAPALDWIITGGETDQGAHKARPADPDWFRSIRDQALAAKVPYHHKQNGEWCQFGEHGLLDDGTMNFLGRPDNAPHGWARFGDDDDCRIVTRVGKKRSGRLIDGVLHDAMPAVL
jgi:protein gp37